MVTRIALPATLLVGCTSKRLGAGYSNRAS